MSAATSTVASTRDASSISLLAPVPLQRLEGVALAALAVGLFAASGTSWWLFASLLLVPDLGMLGYLASPRVGATTYNLTHGLVLPLGLAAAGLWSASDLTVAVALVWVAHIGMDRALGYGLKHASVFADTHLGRVGRR